MSMPVITLKTGLSSPQEITKPASFFLNGSQESFLLKFSAQHDPFFLKKPIADGREIEVFDARKYFNEGLMNHSSPKKNSLPTDHHKKDEPFKSQQLAKLSTMSDSSSNSQSALLNNSSRNRWLRKPLPRGFLANYCSCADRNSVDIDNYADERGKSWKIGIGNGGQGTKLERQEGVDQARKRASVSPNSENQKNRLSLEEKLTTLMSWDAIASAEEIFKIPRISIGMNDGDSDSDGSSDLFEIESLSKSMPFLSRQASDGLSSSACYPPSEASIEWSVVTSSAVDYSVVSDSDELGCGHTKLKQNNSKTRSSFKEIPKMRPGILSGCTSQKAVCVAGDVRTTKGDRVSGAGKHPRPPSDSLTGFGARIRRQSFNGSAQSIEIRR